MKTKHIFDDTNEYNEYNEYVNYFVSNFLVEILIIIQLFFYYYYYFMYLIENVGF